MIDKNNVIVSIQAAIIFVLLMNIAATLNITNAITLKQSITMFVMFAILYVLIPLTWKRKSC